MNLATDGRVLITHEYALSPEFEDFYRQSLADHARQYRLRLGDTVDTANGHRFQLTGWRGDGPAGVACYIFKLIGTT